MNAMSYFIELNEDENFLEYEEYLKFISSERRVQIQNFRFSVDKKLSLFSDLFVRYIACIYLNIDNDVLKFGKNSFGKPYLFGFHNFQYNISHTRNAIVIGLFESSIGVDVERIKNVDLKIAKRCFCSNELDYILSGRKEINELFYEVWTKKEAYIKWSGEGLSIPLKSFDVTNIKLINMIITTKINDYIISKCGESDFICSKCKKLNEDEVYRLISEADCFKNINKS